MGKYSRALPLEPNQGTKELVEQIESDASKEADSFVNKRKDLRECHRNSDAPYRKGPNGRFYRKISQK